MDLVGKKKPPDQSQHIKILIDINILIQFHGVAGLAMIRV
jgi:hypothetical protein